MGCGPGQQKQASLAPVHLADLPGSPGEGRGGRGSPGPLVGCPGDFLGLEDGVNPPGASEPPDSLPPSPANHTALRTICPRSRRFRPGVPGTTTHPGPPCEHQLAGWATSHQSCTKLSRCYRLAGPATGPGSPLPRGSVAPAHPDLQASPLP